jgi:hypothetical protein
MIILRKKTSLFSRRDKLNKKDRLDNEIKTIGVNIKVIVEATKNYQTQYISQPEPVRETIKQQIKSIKEGYYYFDKPDSTDLTG